MRRRDLIKWIAASAAVLPLAARAQPERVRRIGVLMAFERAAGRSEVTAFQEELRKLGWTEGHNIEIDTRWATADVELMQRFAKELVDLRPDAILGQSTAVTVALVRETQTIPIVFVNVADPIGSGFVASLSRPGGNVTGFTTDNSELGGKWIELLKAIAPRTMRVALLFNPATAVPLKTYMPSIQAAASSFAVEVNAAPVHAKDEIEGVIAAQARDPGGGLIVMPDSFNTTNREQIILLAARYGVPAIYYNPAVYAESGGLMIYGSNFAEQFPQAAGYIDRILKGAKPADLPVQAPTKFDLVINLKTAKALGLDVQPALLARADKIIE
jgi:putative tryptophan/tyrosine transport system substrate-binding protein